MIICTRRLALMVFALLAMTYISLAIAEHQGGHDEHETATPEHGTPAPGSAASSTSAPA